MQAIGSILGQQFWLTTKWLDLIGEEGLLVELLVHSVEVLQ